LLFKIPTRKRKKFLEIYRQFGHAPSKRFASPALQEVTREGEKFHTLSTVNKVFFCAHHKRMRGSVGITPPILKLGTRWNGQIHAPVLYPCRKSPWHLLNTSKWSPGPMPTLCRGEKFLPLSGNEPRFCGTALSTLSRLTTVRDLHGAYIKMRLAEHKPAP